MMPRRIPNPKFSESHSTKKPYGSYISTNIIPNQQKWTSFPIVTLENEHQWYSHNLGSFLHKTLSLVSDRNQTS